MSRDTGRVALLLPPRRNDGSGAMIRSLPPCITDQQRTAGWRRHENQRHRKRKHNCAPTSAASGPACRPSSWPRPPYGSPTVLKSGSSTCPGAAPASRPTVACCPTPTIAVKLVTSAETFVVTGMVVRSRVIRLSQGGLGYDVAIAFNETIHRLAVLPTVAAAPPVTTVPPPYRLRRWPRRRRARTGPTR